MVPRGTPVLLLAAYACMLAKCGLAEDEEAAASEEAYPVVDMLNAAVDVLHVDALSSQGGGVSPYADERTSKITHNCVPAELGTQWRTCFQASVDTMLRKTKRDMQRGLQDLSQCVLHFVDAVDKGCGPLKSCQVFREQAGRLQVLASARSLARLDAKHVKYEPLKSLMIADIDIHAELNALLLAWQMNKGASTTGQALARFLAEFASEGEASEAPATTTTEPVHHPKTTPQFWADALNVAFDVLADKSSPVKADCVVEERLRDFSGRLDSAFGSMMQRTQAGMQTGLKLVAQDTQSFLDAVEARCSNVAGADGARRLRTAASRLQVLAGARNLFRPNAQVDYEAMKTLKVGGVDVHLELNKFIISWRDNRPSHEFGDALAKFFSDFKPETEEEEAAEQEGLPGALGRAPHPIWTFLRDSFASAAESGGRQEELDLASDCFPRDATDVFVQELTAAIDHMLEKRKRTMQLGLKGLADATEKLLANAPTRCIWSAGAKLIWLAAKKLRSLTRKTVVDYGTYIKYEAMKSLRVADVPVHSELNLFLVAWKLRSQEEAGKPFGKLMHKLSTIEGHDEL